MMNNRNGSGQKADVKLKEALHAHFDQFSDEELEASINAMDSVLEDLDADSGSGRADHAKRQGTALP
jgi:hypothetical protein